MMETQINLAIAVAKSPHGENLLKVALKIAGIKEGKFAPENLLEDIRT